MITNGRRKRQLVLAVTLIAIGALSAATVSLAQETAIGTATATVLASITVSATSALTFGDVFQGVPSTVADNDGSAAIFDISGQADAGVNVYIQLPEYLALSDGSDRMQISFSATDCSVDTTGAADPTTMAGTKGWQDVDPRSLPGTITIGSTGTSIYLGGKVTPSLFQQAGSYSGDIILTVSYNGS